MRFMLVHTLKKNEQALHDVRSRGLAATVDCINNPDGHITAVIQWLPSINGDDVRKAVEAIEGTTVFHSVRSSRRMHPDKHVPLLAYAGVTEDHDTYEAMIKVKDFHRHAPPETEGTTGDFPWLHPDNLG